MSAVYFTFANLLLCTVWGFGAFLRLRASHKGVLCRVRFLYAGMLVAATASAFQLQLFGEYAGWADITVSSTMVFFIAVGSRRWRRGPPADILKRKTYTHC